MLCLPVVSSEQLTQQQPSTTLSMLSFSQLTSAPSSLLPLTTYAQFNTFSLLPIEDESGLDLYVDKWSLLEEPTALPIIAGLPLLQQSIIVSRAKDKKPTISNQQDANKQASSQLKEILEFSDDDGYCPMHGYHDTSCIFYKWAQAKKDEAKVTCDEVSSSPSFSVLIEEPVEPEPAAVKPKAPHSSPLLDALLNKPTRFFEGPRPAGR